MTDVEAQLTKINTRLAALEASENEQQGAVKFAKWTIAFLIAVGGLALGGYNILTR